MALSENKNQEVFHIGLTMAGAVSAGCYTAGVMDYLFEILELWENCKNSDFPMGWDSEMAKFIPQHKVEIDVMGGASAGGMTTVMAAIYAMKGKINPVSDPSNKTSKKGNLLYDSWVLMGDTEQSKLKLLEKTLTLDDLTSDKIPSLLNSSFIDSICDNAFIDDVAANKKLPNYFSKELELLLSQTMLRSVPLPIAFSTPFGALNAKKDNPKYNTFEHFVISHFKLDYDDTNPLHKDFYLPLAPFGNKTDVDRLKLATKATGAFPIGLSFRKFFNEEFSVEYIKNNSRKLIQDKIKPENISNNPPINFEDVSDPFDFVGVDGGAINNEPIGEVLNVLKERYGEKKEGDYDKFGLIMIDPFPDHNFEKTHKHPEDIFTAIPAILGTLQDQSKLKRKEMLEFHTKDYLRGEIYPVRYNLEEKSNKPNKEENAIACSSVFAFGGFLDINFRHHDFFLGRDNARNFFKVYFSFEYNPEKNIIHPIHRNWTPEMIKVFKFKREDSVTGEKKVFLPIIPNMYDAKYYFENSKKEKRNPFDRTVKEWPQYNAEELFILKPKIEQRVKKMLELTLNKLDKTSQDAEHSTTEKWLKKYYKEGFFKKIGNWFGKKLFSVIISSSKGTLTTKITKSTIEWILKDLEDKKLIK
jgi:hypothetical protein